MLTILHGDNQVKSRDQLTAVISQSSSNQTKLIRLDGKALNLAILEENLFSDSLFGEKKLLIIEGLHSLPKSKKRDQLIDFLSKNTTNDSNLILWEKRPLTATMLKKFPHAKTQEFKTSSELFTWLDAINPDKKTLKKQLLLFDKAEKSDGEQMCFAMLTRQIRLLITARSGGEVKGHPFVVKKVKTQANLFSLDQLVKLHKKLLEIDIKQKTSTGLLSLKADLDLLFINM